MRPPAPENKGPTPAELCSLHDVGGGVHLEGRFAIYSIAAAPSSWKRDEIDQELLAELENTASVVAQRLPILTTTSPDLTTCLSSLPCPPRQRRKEAFVELCNGRPWFLINAALYTRHCILGCHNALESLLMVLQRPWCILELCCCETPVVAAIHDFVMAAAKLGPVIYRPAVILLSHEISQRTKICCSQPHPLVSTTSRRWRLTSGKPRPDAIAGYKELSRNSIRSHKSFWIGLIVTCAIHLELPFCDVILTLGESSPAASLPVDLRGSRDNEIPNGASVKSSEAQIFPSARLCSNPAQSLRVRRSSIHAVQRSQWDSKAERIWKSSDPSILAECAPHFQFLVDLYSSILRVAGDAVS